MILKKEKLSAIQQKNKDLRLYDLCEKGKAIKYIQKHTKPRNLRVFDEVYINIVIIIF